MSFQPFVNPLSPEADCFSTADLDVPQLTTFAARAARKLDQSAARKVIHLRAVHSTLF
jgi:hypothetical protein